MQRIVLFTIFSPNDFSFTSRISPLNCWSPQPVHNTSLYDSERNISDGFFSLLSCCCLCRVAVCCVVLALLLSGRSESWRDVLHFVCLVFFFLSFFENTFVSMCGLGLGSSSKSGVGAEELGLSFFVLVCLFFVVVIYFGGFCGAVRGWGFWGESQYTNGQRVLDQIWFASFQVSGVRGSEEGFKEGMFCWHNYFSQL